MANNKIRHSMFTGQTVYAVFIASAGTWWNGSALASYNVSNWTDYDVVASEIGTTGIYAVTVPSSLPAGDYDVVFYRQSGASPDVTDSKTGYGSFAWDGSKIVVAYDPRGAGANSCTITVSVSGSPVADADVWITSDAGGGEVVAGVLQTNSSGEAVFLLDGGQPYYLWVQKDGINSIRGQLFTAEAD